MGAGHNSGDHAASLSRQVEQYDFRLTDILRKRRRPLLLVIDDAGELLYSSLPDSAPPADHRLLGQAVAETKMLFSPEPESSGPDADDEQPADRQRGTLIMLDGVVYCVRLFPLHRAVAALRDEQFAVVIEPIAGPFKDGIDFGAIKDKFRLSKRELDVLIVLMTGSKDKQIARALGVTSGTVRGYLKSVRAKLGVTTRTAIVNLVHEVSGKKDGGRESGSVVRLHEVQHDERIRFKEGAQAQLAEPH